MFPCPPHLLRHFYFRSWTVGGRAGPTLPAPSPDTIRPFSFAVLHFGDQNITAAVRKLYSDADAHDFEEFSAQVSEEVQRANFPGVIRMLDQYHGSVDYSLTSLFTDEQRRIVRLILNSTLWDIENCLTTIYQDRRVSLLHYLSQAGLPMPPALTFAAGFAVNAGTPPRSPRAIPSSQAQLRAHLSSAKADRVTPGNGYASYIADQRMKRAMVELQMSSGSGSEMLERAVLLARTLIELPFEPNLLASAKHLV